MVELNFYRRPPAPLPTRLQEACVTTMVQFLISTIFRFNLTNVSWKPATSVCRCQPRADGGSLSQRFAAGGRCLPLNSALLGTHCKRGRNVPPPVLKRNKDGGFNTRMPGGLMQIHSKKNHNTWIAPTAGDSTGTFPALVCSPSSRQFLII